MFLSCPSHKKCCLHKKMPSYMFMERGILLLSDNDPTQACGCCCQFGVIIIWGQCILPLSTLKSELVSSTLVSSLLCNGTFFIFPNFWETQMYCHRCHFYGNFTLRSRATGLLDLVLFEMEEFLLCSSSVSALSHLQAVIPIFDLVAKVFSSSFTTDFLPSYNTAPSDQRWKQL